MEWWSPPFNPPREEEQQSTQGQPTEWQRIGNQIDAAFVFAGADLVKLCRPLRLHLAAILESIRAQSDSGASLDAEK